MNSKLEIHPCAENFQPIQFENPQLLRYSHEHGDFIILTEGEYECKHEEGYYGATVVNSNNIHYEVGYHADNWNKEFDTPFLSRLGGNEIVRLFN